MAYTTPTKAILNVLGIQFIELEIISRRLMFLHRNVTSESESLCNKIINEQCKLHGNTWISQHHHGLTSTTRNTLKNVIVAHVKEEHIQLHVQLSSMCNKEVLYLAAHIKEEPIKYVPPQTRQLGITINMPKISK